MDLKATRNVTQMIYQWFTRSENVTEAVPETRRRPPYPCRTPVPLPSASPESQGIKSGYILEYFNRLRREPTIKMQTVTIVRNGYRIACGEFFPYSTDIWHVSHSMCKSLTGLGFVLLCADGAADIEMSVSDVFSSELNPISRQAHKAVKMKHLLNMSTGARFNETGSVSESDWVRAYLDSGYKFRPGSNFEYNSMNTYMISAAVKKLSGKGLFDLLDERIFKPLGITDIYWEKCPKGIEKGGWGLYFYPDDMLKIGQLYLNGGVWEGKRLIPEEWIAQSTKKQITTPKKSGEFDYGYQIWCRSDGSEYLFNGMFGQNLIVFPKINLMILTTAGTDEIFQSSQIYKITDRFFGGGFRPDADLCEDPESCRALREAERSLVMRASDAEKVSGSATVLSKEELSAFEGDFTVDVKDGFGISVMPELYQGVHNNFAKGLTALSLSFDGKGGALTTVEGGTEYRIPFGFTDAVPSCITYGGEDILTSAYAVYDNGGLRITVCFPELPNVRYITVKPSGSGIKSVWEESPGYDFLSELLHDFVFGNADPLFADALKNFTSFDFLERRMKYFLKPELTAVRTGQVL
ncbi:MAG: serine hydrolase [Clostridia bacterium]|nr:serine hydrolase [Clostridia bacterium]